MCSCGQSAIAMDANGDASSPLPTIALVAGVIIVSALLGVMSGESKKSAAAARSVPWSPRRSRH